MSLLLIFAPYALLCSIIHCLYEALVAWCSRPRRIVSTGLPPKAAGAPYWKMKED